MKFKATFRKPRILVNRWKQQLEQRMLAQLKKGAIAWLASATAPIPSWSGASLGTFSELASEVGFTLQIRSTANGRRLGLGPGAGTAASSGRFGGSVQSGVFEFEYSTSLDHLIFNEFNNANLGGDPRVFSSLRTPGPYRFQEQAQAAFLEATRGTRLPEPKFTVRSTRRV